jgi:transcriptional regulator with GAF, ATPase, and Fis domain
VAPALVEGVLFGEEGANVSTRGIFEAAHEGTLLIDEITELPPALQRKLLRAIERGEVCRVGTDRWLHVNVRVIATTRRDLEKEVEASRFREDLYFRLAVGRVELPPLRRRHGDPALLADYFMKRSGTEQSLPSDFLRRYEGYPWPGNVRELQNTVARRVALGDADPEGDADGAEGPDGAPEHAFRWVLEQDLPFTSARDLVAGEFERDYVQRVLDQHGGNVSRAAAASGLARRYFQILRARQRT